MLKMLAFGALPAHALRSRRTRGAARTRADRPAPGPAPRTKPRTHLALPALAAAVGVAVAGTAGAEACSTAKTGAGCITVPTAQRQAPATLPAQATSAAGPQVEIGDFIERGRFSMLLNSEYYGLPPVRDGWIYMRIGRDVYRVDWRTHEVLERVTQQTASNF